MSAIKLYTKFISMKYASRMAYRVDFFMSMIAFALYQFTAPLFILFIYQAGARFPGWNIGQMLLLMGVLKITLGFAYMAFFGIFWKTIDLIRQGTFDILLLRPWNTFLMLLMEGFDEEDLGQFIAGIIIFCIGYSIAKPAGGSLILAAALSFVGLIFLMSLALLCSAASIKFVRTGRLYELIDLIGVFASYPKTVYGKTMAVIFTSVIPLMIVGFYPASAMLGLPLPSIGFTLLSVAMLLIIAILIWMGALKSYTSAGG